ncbi:hypothetical protein [Microbispora rosea]|uniref:hypothetical protein n=1 Tax=Microbispora rosea TaxID=58117 RepID=UPI003792D3E1
MGAELERTNSTGGALAVAGGVIETVVTYGILLVQLAAAGLRLRGLSERVRSTYSYVDGCAEGVDRIADQMAKLKVDVDTIGEHHDAAGVMRSVLGYADEMAAATEDLAGLFQATANAHQADYGTVAAAAQSMPVPMAEAEFYSNR